MGPGPRAHERAGLLRRSGLPPPRRRGTGELVELVDGGAVDWPQKLLSHNKERMVISGIGSERLCADEDLLTARHMASGN